MMAPLQLQSEAFTALGGAAGDGARRAIGRPALDVLVLMVREAIQNSWDARSGSAQVRFMIEVQSLEQSQRDALADLVLAERPAGGLPLDELLTDRPLHVILLSDRGTRGLAGPTRADRIDTDDPVNFVRFFRTIGRASDSSPGGGTYGFGKASLFEASTFHTIVVHSRFLTSNGRPRSRLMAAALGSQYTPRSRPIRHFTGRHWWGKKSDDGIVDPVEGRDADAIARKLGMPGFDDEETGTSIMILQPVFGAASDAAGALSNMVEAALRHAWPRMTRLQRRRAELKLEATLEGQTVKVPLPEEHPWLKGFIAPLRKALDSGIPDDPLTGLRVDDIKCFKPKADLGKLGLQRVFAIRGAVESHDDEAAVFPTGLPHHVALVRLPRLVVRYLPFPALSVSGVGFAGVFIADDEFNGTFADAEPVTHDDWNPDGLGDSRSKTLVRTALKRIREATTAFISPQAQSGGPGVETPLGVFSELMGQLIIDAQGSGPELQDDPDAEASGGRDNRDASGAGSASGGGGRSGAHVRLRILGTAPEMHQGQVLATMRFAIEPTNRESTLNGPVKLRASARVVLASGEAEREGPAGEQVARIVGWEGPRLTGDADLATATIQPGPDGQWAVRATVPRNAMVEISLAQVD